MKRYEFPLYMSRIWVVWKNKKTLVGLLCHGILAHDLPLPQGNIEGRKTSTLNVFCILYIICLLNFQPLVVSTQFVLPVTDFIKATK